MAIRGNSQYARAGLGAAAVGDAIYVAGGHDGESPLKTLEMFTPGPELDSEGEWVSLPPMLARRTYLSVNAAGGMVYAFGGSGDGRMLNTWEVFDPERCQWATWFHHPPMHSKRTLHASVVAGGRLFVCGGFDGLRDMSTVECLEDPTASPDDICWQRKTCMALGRSYLALAAASTLGKHGSFYAIGGQDRHQDHDSGRSWEHPIRVHAEVEIFDLHKELWLEGPPLLQARLGLACATLVDKDGNEVVYACGGSDGQDVLATVERLDVASGTWSEAPPMGVPRLGHAIAVVRNRLYVIGGYDGKEPLDTFECFDPELDKWGPLLPIRRKGSVRAPSKRAAVATPPPAAVILPEEAVAKIVSAIRWGKTADELTVIAGSLGISLREACVVQDMQNGNRPLHIAAQNGHRELTKLLINEGADVNAGNNNGQTALHMSVEYGFVWVTKLLLASGADMTLVNEEGHEAITGIGGAQVDDKAWDSPACLLFDAQDDKEEIDNALRMLERADPVLIDKAALVRIGMQKAKTCPVHWDKARFITTLKHV